MKSGRVQMCEINTVSPTHLSLFQTIPSVKRSLSLQMCMIHKVQVHPQLEQTLPVIVSLLTQVFFASSLVHYVRGTFCF